MDAFNKTKDNITTSVTGAGQFTADKAVEIKDGAATLATNAGKECQKQAGIAQDNAVWVKDKAVEGFETAQKKAGEAFEAAKGTVTNNAETAKDKTVETKKGLFG